MNALEAVVEFIRDSIVAAQRRLEVGPDVDAAPADVLLRSSSRPISIGLIPVFDVLALLNHSVLHLPDGFVPDQGDARRHDRDRQFQRHRGLATITFFAIIIAGTRAHGFVQALEEHGAARPADADLLHPHPDRDHGDVRAAVRADDATCGQHDRRPHRDARDSVVRVHLHRALRHAVAGIGVGLVLSLPLAVGISALEIIVVLVQAYVFTLLTAVFIGMAIHAHH